MNVRFGKRILGKSILRLPPPPPFGGTSPNGGGFREGSATPRPRLWGEAPHPILPTLRHLHRYTSD